MPTGGCAGPHYPQKHLMSSGWENYCKNRARDSRRPVTQAHLPICSGVPLPRSPPIHLSGHPSVHLHLCVRAFFRPVESTSCPVYISSGQGHSPRYSQRRTVMLTQYHCFAKSLCVPRAALCPRLTFWAELQDHRLCVLVKASRPPVVCLW